ncbi:LysR family transcriptional regulator [Elizabethkingia miricola]|uniref:LysR family transcriptional regulator n=1 Tax=Elizabethkingia miricola TaxID=172045 RepID=UPI000B355332|nr:LysR family transcriptional regulator [Elizabethkingia miricola]NHQ67046.1 LysR family transcriptional regulator [Elizabethkingia miricola]NHQ70030.1 LysR family transcriptional regulator [Elizabethkingia miricola]NHQ78109.1 LysR family transcriptional regulator [Elizabethkingia miricola]PSL88833.1 LysR family transcriptional regulator [Elizabethkingia miricola]QHQ88723.1 LysR family transcriptional regulator [Elizabethkingia miricola]
MDFRLKIFCSAAEHKSFTKAAQLNFITQPAVTKNIKELEGELGVSLFERKNARVELTQAGKVYYEYAQQLLKVYEEAQYKVNELKGNFNGRLNIGASTTIGQYILPKVLAEFKQKHPQIIIQMLNANTEEIEKELQESKIDLGFIEGHSGKSSLKYEPVMDDEIVAVVHRNHPLFAQEEISINELREQDFVLRENGSGSLDVIADIFNKNQIRLKDLKVQAQLGSTESIKTFLEYSDCIGFLSIHSLKNELLSGKFKVLEIENFSIKRQFNAVYMHGNFDGIPKLFLDFFHKYNKKL